MNHIWLNQAGNGRLLLFFNGWGMDEKPFSHMGCNEMDAVMFCDYTTLDTPLNLSKICCDYDEIFLAAWSMGVWAAAKVLEYTCIDITKALAINGTLKTISEEFGIAPNIFQGTIDSWSADSREKFYRRMCGRGKGFEFFMSHSPARSAESQLEELKSLQSMYLAEVSGPTNIFTHAIIARRDRVIPADAQKRFWTNEDVKIIETKQAHYIFDEYENFRELIDIE